MTLGGSYARTISSPFTGIQCFGNGNQAATTVSLSDAPGRYRIDLRGAPVPAITGALTSGVWRNLFAESGRSQADIDAKVNLAWQ